MINVSRFVDTQREVRSLTELYVTQLKNAIRFNYTLPLDKALRDESIAQLYQTFLEEYTSTGVDWTDVLAELDDAASVVKLFLINGKSDEALDYAICQPPTAKARGLVPQPEGWTP